MRTHDEILSIIESIEQNMDSPEDLKNFIGDGTMLKFTDRFGVTALHWAAGQGKIEVVNAIIAQAPSTISAKDKYGRTPLELALVNGHTEVAEAIVAQDLATIEAKHKDGRSALEGDAEHGQTEVLELLLLNIRTLYTLSMGIGALHYTGLLLMAILK